MSKVPCGGFKLDENFLGMNENDELSLTGGGEGKAYQQLVTDGDGNVKWEDRLAYEYTEWRDFALSLGARTEITGFTMPPVGDTVTVKVNGVESVETVKSGEIEGQSYSYIGSIDMAELGSGAEGWIVFNIGGVYGLANPETNVSLFITEQHKIDEKYIQQDKNFVRPLSYCIDGYALFKNYYNESGEEVTTYKCDSIKLPDNNRIFVYDLAGEMGMGNFIVVEPKAFFTGICIFTTIGTTSKISHTYEIYGTDETAITELAAKEGYTLTTKPTT